MKSTRSFRIFAILTAFGAYLMLLMGAIVTKTGSGEGCGNSWPFCHGQLIPESMPVHTVIEYSHRVVSGMVGLMILILTIWAWKKYRHHRHVKLFSFLSFFFAVFQGALGALTVVFRGYFVKKAMLALHFGFSLISFASVAVLVILLYQMKEDTAETEVKKIPVSKKIAYYAWGLAAYTYVVVYTGAYVRHTKATMGCGYQFPLCGEQYFPSFTSLAGIHMLHRYASILLWLLVLGFMIVVYRRYRSESTLWKSSWLAFLFITLQAASGVATVLSGGQLMVALLHTTIISIFFSILTYICLRVGVPWKISDK